MSRSTDVASRGKADAASGFTLIEIVVALGILMLVLIALLPQLVAGIRSTGVARQVTQTKGITQGQIERMSNLPFHISPDAGPYVDLLDNFYPNNSTLPAPVSCTSADGSLVAPLEDATGFVASTAPRCVLYEPPLGGSFYRTVKVTPPSGDMGGYTTVVDAQFLSDATPPVAVDPVTGYDTQTTGKDNPPASQIGVTVTVFSARYPSRRPTSLYTQISSESPSTTMLRGRASARTLEIGSVVLDLIPDPDERLALSLSAGLLNLAGSASNTSKMTVNRGALVSVLGNSTTSHGLSTVDTAPPGTATTSDSSVAGALPEGCAYACWGGASLNAVSLSAAGGLPVAGSAASPVRSELTGTENSGFRFGNATDPADYDASLAIQDNVIQLDTGAPRTSSAITPCASRSGTAQVSGAGYVTSTATDVESCAAANTGVVELFPTPDAPDGVVRIELIAASASCQVRGVDHVATVSFDYEVLVRYWDQTVGLNGGYRTAGGNPITKATGSDVLAGIDLSSISVGGGKNLSHYVASWSSLTAERVKLSTSSGAAGGTAEISMPGVVSVSTRPTRSDPSITDPDDQPSVISLTVGALSCYAEDRR